MPTNLKLILIYALAAFAIGWFCGFAYCTIHPPVVLMDPVQLQEYLNTNPTADPAFELLEVDGRIGPKTIKAWEWVSAHQVELEMP